MAERPLTARGFWLDAAVLAALFGISVLFTWPLLPLAATHIAGDVGDPVLNASVLWWNATTTPLSEHWWNPPYFFPTDGITAFTENLLGLMPIAAPIYWLTGNPLTTYNLTTFLAWPLSAFALYLLVKHLTGRRDAAIVASLIFGFSPYRTQEVGHLQMVSSYWIPPVLLGLHKYLETRRLRWLFLFGAAWALQALVNLYMLVFGAVLVGLWLLYFSSTRSQWRVAIHVVAAWGVASATLLPILVKYRTIHAANGFERSVGDPVGFSLLPDAWIQVSQFMYLWDAVLSDRDNLFPGAMGLVLLIAGWTYRWRDGGLYRRPWSKGERILAYVLAAAAAVALFTIVIGPWRIAVGFVTLRVSDIDRALLVALLCSAVLLFRSARVREALRRRDGWLFYSAAIVLFALMAFGPVVRLGNLVVAHRGPYWWLMQLPGVENIRAPYRIWMLGVLCLAVAAGYGYSVIVRRFNWSRAGSCALVSALVLAESWAAIPMEAAPPIWPDLKTGESSVAIIELPLGPYHDAASTIRAIGHRRPVVNGVSGHDPPHYSVLQDGLEAKDASVLDVLRSFADLDVVITAEDAERAQWEAYAASVPGTVRLGGAARPTYRLPHKPWPIEALGPTIPIVRAHSHVGDAAAVFDGRSNSFWQNLPQEPGQWVVVDLGEVQSVAGIGHTLWNRARDYPRELIIEVSRDGSEWKEVFRSGMVARAMYAAIRRPADPRIELSFPAAPGRYVRLRQVGKHRNYWLIGELTVHGPASPQAR